MSDLPYTIDIVERLKEAIKQRTCMWDTDIKLVLTEIELLRKENEWLKQQLETKKQAKKKPSTEEQQ